PRAVAGAIPQEHGGGEAMEDDGGPIRVGVCWDDLAASPEQLGRIAAASRADPIMWDGEAPAPDVEVLIADDVPAVIPHEMPHLPWRGAPGAWLRDARAGDLGLCARSGAAGHSGRLTVRRSTGRAHARPCTRSALAPGPPRRRAGAVGCAGHLRCTNATDDGHDRRKRIGAHEAR